MDNAIKNTFSYKVSIDTVTNNAFVEITVDNNNPSIPADQLAYAFERFYQVSGLRTGAGLKLEIA